MFVKSMENPLNCWKFLKLTEPQHKNEIGLGVKVTKVEKIGLDDIRLKPKCLDNG